METWKDIRNFEGLYEVSDNGRIKSIERIVHNRHISEKILKPWIGTTGYYTVALSKNGILTKLKIHRIVAFHFNNNPHNLNFVNHKDGDKLNNCIDNLELCTQAANNLHAHRTGLVKRNNNAIAAMNKALSVPIAQYKKDGTFLKWYPSISEASRQTNIHLSAISACGIGKRNSSGGFLWKKLNTAS